MSMGGKKPRCLVTGGAGFLGQHIVTQLLQRGHYDVVIFDIRATDDQRVSCIVGDLRKPEQVAAAVAGCEAVFHVATAAPTGENATNKTLMSAVNVDGTRHIIDACVASGTVKRLIYTSSASVVFEGKHLYNVNEAQPYAAKPMDFYTETKIEGEQLILAAAGRGGLTVVALRPSGIFGEGDLIFVPTTVRNAIAGKLKYIIGDGSNRMDWTYVGNIAHAHLLADDALSAPETAAAVSGKPYFITNQDPQPFWGTIGDVCEGLGYRRPSIHLPFLLIYIIALIFEVLLLPLIRLFKPKVVVDFSVNRILIATTNRTFDSSAATRELKYKPTVNMKDAMTRTLLSFAHLRADSSQGAARAEAPSTSSSSSGVKPARTKRA
ncbi:MAG: hypothetical protein WDW38_004458 [Sanguina aurantia]